MTSCSNIFIRSLTCIISNQCCLFKLHPWSPSQKPGVVVHGSKSKGLEYIYGGGGTIVPWSTIIKNLIVLKVVIHDQHKSMVHLLKSIQEDSYVYNFINYHKAGILLDVRENLLMASCTPVWPLRTTLAFLEGLGEMMAEIRNKRMMAPAIILCTWEAEAGGSFSGMSSIWGQPVLASRQK